MFYEEIGNLESKEKVMGMDFFFIVVFMKVKEFENI